LQGQLTRVFLEQLSASGSGPSTLAQQLLISGEDRRFFSHGGVDLIAICRAFWRGTVFRKREGASTIEMQVIRVVGGRFERTLRRKLREMALATLVTRVIPKEFLPAVYLRIGYYGWRMNGFESACLQLGIGGRQMSKVETAELVARLKYPQPRVTPPERARQIKARAHHLLRLHSKHKYDKTYANILIESAYETV
jgi:membrane carboxypeptidase/penicillin-binding protein PbpC